MPPDFIEFCAYFNGNQDYFECHEVLEEYWKKVDPGNKEHLLVGFIQLATGLYHWRRENMSGASRMLKKAYDKIVKNKAHPFFDYIHFQQLCNDCLKSIDLIEKQQPFEAFPFIFIHPTFEALVNEKIISLPAQPHDFLLHKHMLRDRSDILRLRKEKRNGRR